MEEAFVYQMAPCSLTELPTALFQAILQHLASQDHASLRLVSRSVCKRTTPHVKHITMLLSESSSTHQLQQWFQATRQLQHVTNVHVQIRGDVSADTVELAMQLLSQRSSSITELHLLAVGGDVSWRMDWAIPSQPRGSVPSISPLQHLLPQLHTWVVEGIAVQDMANDIIMLAKAAAGNGGWQLQNLILKAEWCPPYYGHNAFYTSNPFLWTKFAGAAKHLAAAFPHLQQLELQMPLIGIVDEPGKLTIDGVPDVDDAMRYMDEAARREDIFRARKLWAAAAGTAALITLAKAVLQLKGLRMLTVSSVPDVWNPVDLEGGEVVCFPFEVRNVSAAAMMAAMLNLPDTLTAAGLEAIGDRAAAMIPPFQMGPAAEARRAAKRAEATQTASAATRVAMTDFQFYAEDMSSVVAREAFGTLDGYGCWLLQQHPTLQQLQISTRETGWGMAWKQKQQQKQKQLQSPSDGDESSGACEGTTAAEILAGSATVVLWDDDEDPYLAEYSTSSSSREHYFHALFTRHLSHYSSRSEAERLSHVSSCKLDVSALGAKQGLSVLLADLKSLKHLQIRVCPDYTEKNEGSWATSATAAAVAVVAAAAAIPHLESLTVHIDGSVNATIKPLPADLLLPLTAAAEGPGSSLKKLQLRGNFQTDVPSDSYWTHVLKQLDGLTELRLCQEYHKHIVVPVDSLPNSLQVLDGCLISFCNSDATAAAAANGAVALGDQTLATGKGSGQLSLRHLHLWDCDPIDPSILASEQLQQLTIHSQFMIWSGAWTAAAAAAWPKVRQLRCFLFELYLAMLVTTDEAGKAIESAAENRQPCISQFLQDITANFRHLKSLALYETPWLSVDNLQPVPEQLQQLSHLEIGVEETHSSSESEAEAACKAVQEWLQRQQPYSCIDINWTWICR